MAFKHYLRLITLSIVFMSLLWSACDRSDKKQDRPEDLQIESNQATVDQAVTLPLLDALFYESDFASSLKGQLGLTKAQVEKLKNTAHNSVANLIEDGAIDPSSAKMATQQYTDQVREVIGEEKARLLLQLISDRYSKGVEGLAPARYEYAG